MVCISRQQFSTAFGVFEIEIIEMFVQETTLVSTIKKRRPAFDRQTGDLAQVDISRLGGSFRLISTQARGGSTLDTRM